MKNLISQIIKVSFNEKVFKNLPWLLTVLLIITLASIYYIIFQSAEKRVSKFFESEAEMRSVMLMHHISDQFHFTSLVLSFIESQNFIEQTEFHSFTGEMFSQNYSVVSFYYVKPEFGKTFNEALHPFVLKRMGLHSVEKSNGVSSNEDYSLPVVLSNSKSFSVFPSGFNIRAVKELSEEIEEAIISRAPRLSKKVTIFNEGVISDYLFTISPHYFKDSLGGESEKLRGIAISQISLDKVFYEAIANTRPKNIYTELYLTKSSKNTELLFKWKPRGQDDVSMLATIFNFKITPHTLRQNVYGKPFELRSQPGSAFVGYYFPNSLPILAVTFVLLAIAFFFSVKSYFDRIIKNNFIIHKVEEEAYEKEMRYKNLFNSITDMIFIANGKTGMLEEANTSARTYLGYTESEIKEIHFTKLHPPEEQQFIIPEFEKTKSGTYRLFATKITTKSGRIIPVEINAVQAMSIRGELFMIGIFRDITERKIAEMELKRINKELQELSTRKDKFLSIIAHDMINPFSGIMGFSEHIVEDYENMTDKEVVESATRVVQAANQAYRLLENLLRWAKLQFEDSAVQKKEILVDELMKSIVKGCSFQTAQKKITIQQEFQERLRIHSDPDIISFIIRNLIANAIKFSRENSTIEVVTSLLREENGEMVKISVMDYGVGMSTEQQNALFSNQELMSTQGTKGEKGTGLGLKMCFEFAQRIGAKLAVESELGKGTTISLLIY